MQHAFNTNGQINAVIQKVEELQKVPGGPYGYRLRRIILINFWLYTQQVFEIPHGRLFLAGKNASGKSTVLTAALPLALEGSLRPERLDTFGGKYKRIEYYVLGDEDSATSFKREKCTSYVALEFEWCSLETEDSFTSDQALFENSEKQGKERARYLTVGISLYGNEAASTRIQPMYFLITDGSRLLKEIQLISQRNGEEQACTQHDFKGLLKGHGILCNTQEQYVREVASHLFGFDSPDKFRKLIELLLVLRSPNPSDKLSVPAVQKYLTESLPIVPEDMVRDAVETIGEIDNLKHQARQMESEYQAVLELENAQQRLVLSKVRLAGYHYQERKYSVEQLEQLISSFRKDLEDIERKKQEITLGSKEMNAEKQQVTGKIAALETGKGIEAAKQIVEARNRVIKMQEQLAAQQHHLERARDRRKQSETKVATQRHAFSDKKLQLERKMIDIHRSLLDKAVWYERAEQFRRGSVLMEELISVQVGTEKILAEIAGLTVVGTDQRLKWLQELEQIHQEKNHLDQAIEAAQRDEKHWLREVEALWIQFKGELATFYTGSQHVEQVLSRSMMPDERTPINAFIMTDEIAHEEALPALIASFVNINDATSYLEQCREQIEKHKKHIETSVYYQSQRIQHLDNEIDGIKLEKGLCLQRLQEKEAEYEQEKKQSEGLRVQPQHRMLAREKLAAQNIPAFPLYCLLDFVPASAGEEVGRIERMLEDAGLLDALVILEDDCPTADRVLQAEELSDYRLNLARFEPPLATHSSEISQEAASRWFQFDAAIQQALPQTGSQWEATMHKVIPQLEALLMQPERLFSEKMALPVTAANPPGKWQHGLLLGQSGKGQAQFIGRTTRQHAQEQKLANLVVAIADLSTKREELAHRLNQYEEWQKVYKKELEGIQQLLVTSSLIASEQKLSTLRDSLDSTNKRYEEQQKQTHAKLLEHSQITKKLVEKSGSLVVFIHEYKKVQIALFATREIGHQSGLLQRDLQTMRDLCQDILETQQRSLESQDDEHESQSLYNSLENQLLQAQSLVNGLQEILDAPEAQNLIQQLEDLRRRAENLEGKLRKATGTIATFDERSRLLSEALTTKEIDLPLIQGEAQQQQRHFQDLLATYAVPELREASDLVAAEQYTDAIHLLQTHLYTQTGLQTEQQEAQKHLYAKHEAHKNFLYEYGPDLDEKTSLITFVQMEGATPFELLNRLAHNQQQQQNLLRQKERELFENFLLRRMIDVVYKHIQEAREWVHKINERLKTMPTVHDYYELDWQPRAQQEETVLGSYLAKRQKLFNKPLTKLTEDEQNSIKEAFRQEIESIWDNEETTAGLNFEQKLQKIFDYRQWFQFRVSITPKGGQKFLLTNQTLGTRSGAERLFALLVPLLAAVAACYNQAAPGAPRLLALDEAFDRASFDNMKIFVEYLAAQDFQWIMTGPQLNASGTQIPASIRYLMLHEKGKQVATALPKIWQSNSDIS